MSNGVSALYCAEVRHTYRPLPKPLSTVHCARPLISLHRLQAKCPLPTWPSGCTTAGPGEPGSGPGQGAQFPGMRTVWHHQCSSLCALFPLQATNLSHRPQTSSKPLCLTAFCPSFSMRVPGLAMIEASASAFPLPHHHDDKLGQRSG